jgi:hypothetical protein
MTDDTVKDVAEAPPTAMVLHAVALKERIEGARHLLGLDTAGSVLWRHKKSLREYVVSGVALEERTLTAVVIYNAVDDGLWPCRFTRPILEFLSRFERVR